MPAGQIHTVCCPAAGSCDDSRSKYILQNSPELKQFLEKGTSYKLKFCDDDRILTEICGDLVHEVVDRTASKDNLNQAMFGKWVKSVNATLGLELDHLEARRAARAEGGE